MVSFKPDEASLGASFLSSQSAHWSSSRYGADARAEDLRGNSPAHFAAAKGHLAVLTALLQVLAPPCSTMPPLQARAL